MKKVKLLGSSLVALGSSVSFVAYGDDGGKVAGSGDGKGDAAHSAVIITDTGGVDGKPFNQSPWEGLQAWGKEHDLPEGSKGYAYIQSSDVADYATNIDQAVSSKFNTILGIDYLPKGAISSAADANPDTDSVLIDDQIDSKKDAVPATLGDNETTYLASVAAVNETKTDKAGFVGGEEGVVTGRSQTDFEKGVADAAKGLGKEITVDTRYVASFADPTEGKALAAVMYQNGVDTIFHASGTTGQGVFQEAKDLNESGSGDKVWVVGADRDQDVDGEYKIKGGKEDSFTLTSTFKGVGTAVQDITNRVLEDKFPGGEHLVHGLKDDGVDLTDGYLDDRTKEAVKTAKGKVISGDVKVPERPE